MKNHNKMRFMSILQTLLLVFIMIVPMVAVPTISMAAQPTVDLGTTESFAVLAGSGITNTGLTTINGDAGSDVGASPTGTFTGQASVTMSGTAYLADAAAILAKTDLVTAYNDAAGRTPVTRIPTELGGTTLTPGVYDSADGTFQITGTLTLDGQNDLDPVFVFKTASTLITASNSDISLTRGARYCRTFWQVGSSATLGANSYFVGHIFALQSITANNGATVQGQLLARNGAVTLDSNTITNGFCATPAVPTTATFHVIKHVINDNSGIKTAADFNLHVKNAGIDVATSPAAGIESPGKAYTLAAGTYVVSEDADAGYTAIYSGDCDASGNITLAAGDNKTVMITNNDIAAAPIIPTTATLHVIKHVINDDSGTAVAAAFNVSVKNSVTGVDVALSPLPGVESPGTLYTLPAGSYVVSEGSHAGYLVGYSGNSDSAGNITLVAGTDNIVTVTNNDIPVVASSGGGGSSTVYPPLINVVKTPEPLALTSGSGSVTYTYKVTNPGRVSLNKVSVTDDKVSPVKYISGDTNSDNLLQTDETWIYSSQVTLNKTTTNTATAKGSANGITAVDVAFATVVVTTNVPVYYPPLINVVKIPEPLALTSGAGLVTYTYKVTNPGLVPLSNVTVTDDKVSPVRYVSGDVNADNLLQPNETWIYNSKTKLNETTTNTATVKGSAKGMTAIDIALATVVVTQAAVVTPTVTGGQLPKTSTPLYTILLFGLVLAMVGIVIWRRKHYE